MANAFHLAVGDSVIMNGRAVPVFSRGVVEQILPNEVDMLLAQFGRAPVLGRGTLYNVRIGERVAMMMQSELVGKFLPDDADIAHEYVVGDKVWAEKKGIWFYATITQMVGARPGDLFGMYQLYLLRSHVYTYVDRLDIEGRVMPNLNHFVNEGHARPTPSVAPQAAAGFSPA